MSRTVWILSLVSLFADVASEMLYPVVPLYLRDLGFSLFLIGLLEGVVECTAGITKGYFGKLSDETGRRLPYIRGGYLLSALSKPLMVVFAWPLWVFGARTMDRLGKGMRTAARDAMLSAAANPENRARVFGFHRGMDTAGAVAGPLIALLFLHFLPGDYKLLFYWAFLPGIVAVTLLFLLKETRSPSSTLGRKGFFSFFGYWKKAPRGYRKLVTGLLFFALFNSSDVFLLLKTREVTGSDTLTIGAYIFYNAIFAIFSFPMGALADKKGYRPVMVLGLVLFAIVYGGFAFANSTPVLFILFFLYGIFAAATDGLAKAWISRFAPKTDTGTAIGLFTSGQSLASLVASSTAGLLWSLGGSSLPFLISALAAFITAFYFYFKKIAGPLD